MAFVRYRYEDELRLAIYKGNGRNLSVRLLLVRKALARIADRGTGGQRYIQLFGQFVRRGYRFVSPERWHQDKTHRNRPLQRKWSQRLYDDEWRSRPSKTLPISKDKVDQEVNKSKAASKDQNFTTVEDDALVDQGDVIVQNGRDWLERSFVMNMISEGVSRVSSFLSSCHLKLGIFELSNTMLLVSMEDEELIEDGIKLVSEKCQGLVSEVFPWESTGFKRKSIVRIQLSDNAYPYVKAFGIPLVATGYASSIKFKIDVHVEREGSSSIKSFDVLPEFFDGKCSGEHRMNSMVVRPGPARPDRVTRLTRDPVASPGRRGGATRGILARSTPGGKLKKKLGQRQNRARCKVCAKNKRKMTRRGVTKMILGDAAQVDLDSDISLTDVESIRTLESTLYEVVNRIFEILVEE
ncbi:hypothetical protein CCACVL1_05413 [Corchorus capsularis]|uniref:Uncharacterized protein n=1 Tax=Corchorus capsularis TaxID=210143 RepID=A0A1R3JKP5_COCAP|nr:hypothetical protein CCACVL1_05413 [Corchorus capsularis]